ncbi:hypothetical protein RvVAT039_00280 [Agrobacterium vitis]|nr:hypothetical protein RvVAT039_00280 [Agrobacterium vitis]
MFASLSVQGRAAGQKPATGARIGHDLYPEMLQRDEISVITRTGNRKMVPGDKTLFKGAGRRTA